MLVLVFVYKTIKVKLKLKNLAFIDKIKDSKFVNDMKFNGTVLNSSLATIEFNDDKNANGTKDDGEIMAVKHRDYNVYGLQFHPESILTPDGLTIIRNFIEKVNRGIL